jgi:hypothetical protein
MIRFTSPSPDVTNHVKLWNLNRVSGEESMIGPMPEPKEETSSRKRGCDQFAKLGDLEACGNEETLVVSRSGEQIGRFQIQVNTCPIDNHGNIGKCETPIRSLDWTEDGKWLLIGEEGLNDGSGQRQDDYYLVNLATMKLSTVASAYTAFWLPGRNQIVYITPQDLAFLPGGPRKRNVWVQQLMFFDPVKGVPVAITSGLTNNVDPSWCASKRQPLLREPRPSTFAILHIRLAAIFAHRFTAHLDAMGVVNQPVEDPVGWRRIADLSMPGGTGSCAVRIVERTS